MRFRLPLVMYVALAAGAFAAWATTPATRRLEPDVPLPMRPGDRAVLRDTGSLAYVGVRSDSRCPPDVTCIHAGWVELDFVHSTPGQRDRPFVLSTQRGLRPVRIGMWNVELTEVGRGASPLAHVRASITRN